MASTKQLQKRIKSVTNISKITKAMEMVSASKMRHAQSQALASRIYSRKLEEIITKISHLIHTNTHPLLQPHANAKKSAILIISTDRGLTGSLNANLFRNITEFQQKTKADVYTIGRLAKEYAIKSGFDLVAQFGEVTQEITYENSQAVSGLLIKEYTSGKYQHIWLAYMDFISTLSQKPRIIQLLPINRQLDDQQSKSTPLHTSKLYTFEPDPLTLLDSLLPYSVELTVYQSMLEARASEHSARMVAMKNASDNATSLKDNLSLKFNRSRQASITSELTDIVTATLSIGS